MGVLQILLLLLLAHPCLSEATPKLQGKYVWRFFVLESYTKGGQTVSHLVTTADCPPSGCSKSIRLSAPSNSFRGLDGARFVDNFPIMCFLYDQTREKCKQWPDRYGGCPFYSCRSHMWPKGQQPWALTITDP